MADLTALQVRNAKSGRHSDGRGLYLVVHDSGSRAWVARVQADGKRRGFGLGSAETISLGAARSAAAELRRKYKSGEDVKTRRASAKAARAAPSFERAARACHAAVKAGWRNAKHIDPWIACLEYHVFSAFGAEPVDRIDSFRVRDAFAPIWFTMLKTARRALQRVGVVLD